MCVVDVFEFVGMEKRERQCSMQVGVVVVVGVGVIVGGIEGWK